MITNCIGKETRGSGMFLGFQPGGIKELDKGEGQHDQEENDP